MKENSIEPNAVDVALKACRSYVVAAAAFSLAINLLYLTSPLFMLQVYNRVVNSGSVVTLVLLTVILLIAFASLSLLDAVRARVLSRMALRLDRLLATEVFAASFTLGTESSPTQPVRDLDTFRQFVASGVVSAIFDLPWVPIYVIAAFLLHPAIGAFTLVASILLFGLAILNELLVSQPLRLANQAAVRSYGFAEMSVRNAEVVEAMGMLERVSHRWGRDRLRFMAAQTAAADRASALGSIIRFLRLSMQSLILGLGALLAVARLVSAGAMFASTFLLGRTLQPIEQIVGAWRNIVMARVAYVRVRDLLSDRRHQAALTELPHPAGQLSLDNLHFALTGATRFALRGISLSLKAGEALGVVGPSGAGKSTLMRLIVGVLKPTAGAVRIDGADIQHWPRAVLGKHLGYLPQDIELFADTVAANISRFTPDADAEIVKAAQMAGVHEMIQRLPQGYNTQIGDGGASLSGGYRQRIGLARAVFGIPSLVVLDEPSSNLDADGDAALQGCIAGLKALGSTVIIVSHRPTTLGIVDKILFLKEGAVEAYGPREQIATLLAPKRPAGTTGTAAHG